LSDILGVVVDRYLVAGRRCRGVADAALTRKRREEEKGLIIVLVPSLHSVQIKKSSWDDSSLIN
jgi:hypothetical protein